LVGERQVLLKGAGNGSGSERVAPFCEITVC
jgi:hypothetical protein